MAEIKTQPVTALCLSKNDFHDKRIAGSFYVSEPDSDKEQSFWYCCPCGCKAIGPLTVGKDFKPDFFPSWNWNGSLEKPTLTPSINHVNHWHGFLTDGIWLSC